MLEVKAVTDWLRLAEGQDVDLVASVVAATNAWAAGNLPAVAELLAPEDVWPAHVTQGLTMLAARLYRRRNTPSGVEAFADGGAVYLPRRDSDVDLLLGIGFFARPAVG